MFTPGPWHVVSKDSNILVKQLTDGEVGQPICIIAHNIDQIDGDKSRSSHNASLVAAAPDMHRMLVQLSSMLTDINAHVVVNEIEALLKKIESPSELPARKDSLLLFEKEYDGESICDVSRDVYEVLSGDHNHSINQIPVDTHGIQRGIFTVRVDWES